MTHSESNTGGAWQLELDAAIAIVRDAAREVKRFYDAANAGVYVKEDKTPLTDADLASDKLIHERLRAEFPADAILTEETADDPIRLQTARIWIADPIDGTQQFVNRTGEFDIFLALVVDGRPVVGICCHPPSGQLLAAAAGAGAFVEQDGVRRPLRFPAAPPTPLRVATSHYHGAPASLPMLTDAAARAGGGEPVSLPIGFQARAFVDPANGLPRYEVFAGPGREIDGPNYSGGEWDNAAPDLIVWEAGGALTDLRGRPYRYNKADPRNFGGILAASDRATHARFVAALAAVLPPADRASDDAAERS